MRRGTASPFVIVTVAWLSDGSSLGVRALAANPPKPMEANVPDPPVTAPTRTEAPTILRKHRAGCFVFFPSGGSLPASCPAALASERIGALLECRPDGRCRHVPLRGSAGKTGDVPCPAVLETVFEAGVLGAASWVGPRPARLAPIEPVAESTGCAHAHNDARACGAGVVLVGLAVGARRRARVSGRGGDGRPRR